MLKRSADQDYKYDLSILKNAKNKTTTTKYRHSRDTKGILLFALRNVSYFSSTKFLIKSSLMKQLFYFVI